VQCVAGDGAIVAHRIFLLTSNRSIKQLIEDLDIEHHEVGEKFIEDFDVALPEGYKLCRGIDGKLLYQTKPGAKGKKPDPNVFNLNSPAQLLKKFTALLGHGTNRR
jgi:hypothetical protein